MKKIEDYDLKSFNSHDKFDRIFHVKHDSMWLMEKEKRLQDAIKKWTDIDNSEESQDKLFARMFHEAFFNKNTGDHVFQKVLQFTLTDRHCAFVWGRLIYMIPEASSSKYTSKLSQIKDHFQYKEFKKSVVELSLEDKQVGFIILMKLLDKNVLGFKNIIKLLDTDLIYYIPQIKLPEKCSIGVIDTLQETLEKIDRLTVQKVSIKYNEILCQLLDDCIDKYPSLNLYTHLIDSFKSIAPQTQELLKDNGIYPKLLSKKLNLSLADTIKTSKKIKI